MMALQTVWFILIAIMWTAFFVLEGFDFGVGMLAPFLGRDDTERRMLQATIGPFWDGNEVWLILAGGATFAAFPDWYATLFSAYYLPLFLVLVALILRAVGFEYRNRIPTRRWRSAWDWLMAGSCLLVPLLVGVAFGGMLNGIPIDQQKEFTGTFGDLVQPYALATGVLFATLCLVQGLVFIRIKATDDLGRRATGVAVIIAWVAIAVLAVHIVWTRFVVGSGIIPNLGAWLALTAAVATAWLVGHPGHRGWAVATSTATIAFTLAGFFGELYPNLMVSTTAAAYDITKADSSGSYTLKLMSVIALVMLPITLLYTGWSYWVFRQRVTRQDVSVEPTRARP
jgi:cytochrome d ubiquinol oxidase subunit II